MAVNKKPVCFSDHSGSVSRRRVILPFPDAIPASERDSLVDLCGYLMPQSLPTGLFIGNANIRPLNPKRYLYQVYLPFK